MQTKKHKMNTKFQKQKSLLMWFNSLLIFSATTLIFLISCQNFSDKSLTYKVQSGDNLAIIEKLTGVSQDKIIDANNLKNTQLEMGQLLTIPGIDSLEKGNLLQKLEIIPRKAWGAQPISTLNPSSTFKKLTVHHTTEPTSQVKSEEELLRIIQKYHQQTKNWGDIAYHFLISHDGKIYQGRDLSYSGAHVYGHNEGNIGIAILGNYDEHELTEIQINTLRNLIDALREKYDIPKNEVFGHKELGKTDCPGKHTIEFLNEYRKK